MEGPVEGPLVGVHVEHVHGEVVGRDAHLLEHLPVQPLVSGQTLPPDRKGMPIDTAAVPPLWEFQL